MGNGKPVDSESIREAAAEAYVKKLRSSLFGLMTGVFWVLEGCFVTTPPVTEDIGTPMISLYQGPLSNLNLRTTGRRQGRPRTPRLRG